MKMTATKEDRYVLIQKYSAVSILMLLLIFNSLFTPNFFKLSNLNNVITQICPTILCGMGMTIVISTGGIDISVGSVMALAGVITAKLMPDTGIAAAICIALVASLAVGIVNGFFVGQLKLQAMVITLGTMLGIRGLAQVVCDGRDIYFNKLGETGDALSEFGKYKLFGAIPVQIIPIVASVIVIFILMEKTILGRQIQAVGDNERSSFLSGIKTSKVTLAVYGISAVLAGMAGILQSAKVTVAAGSSLGQLAELDAIAAVVIGGTPMSGGKAHVLGTIVGALIMQMITLTCVMNNIPEQYAQVIKALIIVIAVFVQREQSK